MAIKFVLKQNLPNTPAQDCPTLGEYEFNGAMFTAGSDHANDLVLEIGAPEQFVVVPEENHLMLISRAEGIQLNGENLRREAFHPLENGDEIRVGTYSIFVIDDELIFAAPETTKVTLMPESEENPFVTKTYTLDDIERDLNSENPATKPPASRNFADVLDALRTEEDSFYFTVKNGEQETARVMLETEETPIGAGGKTEIVFSIDQISTLYAIARKDWSGILIESQKRNSVFVNGEAVETTRRLRNDDRLTFAQPNNFSLVLHEPSSLVALESLLSARVAENGTRFGGLAASRESSATPTPNSKPAPSVPFSERRFFGFFSLIEIVTMIIGTLIGAILFFLLFEFMFS